ncbi:hypothetical protein YPPY54_4408, partial [Yersinia pestis PY-54]
GSILGRWWRYKWITFHPSLTIIKFLSETVCSDIHC